MAGGTHPELQPVPQIEPTLDGYLYPVLADRRKAQDLASIDHRIAAGDPDPRAWALGAAFAALGVEQVQIVQVRPSAEEEPRFDLDGVTRAETALAPCDVRLRDRPVAEGGVAEESDRLQTRVHMSGAEADRAARIDLLHV